MNPEKFKPKQKKGFLPKGMRPPRILTFNQRVWREEVIQQLRKIKESRKKDSERIPIKNREIIYSYSKDLWYRIIWNSKVKEDLRAIWADENHKNSKTSPQISPSSNLWISINNIKDLQPESARTS